MKKNVCLALWSFFLLSLFAGRVLGDDDRFWLDVKINGQPARMLFDTGSESTGLWPASVKRLGLEIDVPVPDMPAENGKVGVGKTKPAAWEAGGTGLPTAFMIWPSDPVSYDKNEHDGTIGWPQANDNVWLMEAATHTLRCPKVMAPEAATWTRFRVLTNYDILALEVPGPGRKKFVVDIDTGKLGGGVTLSPERWLQWKNTHPHRPKTLQLYHMFGAGNVLKEESWADKLAVGSLVLTDVPVTEANNAEVANGSNGYAATLGMDALKRLDLVVDGKNNIAYIRPKQTPPAPFPHNRLGAVFIDDREGVELLAHVAPGSPAEEAGIRDGDILLKVDDRDVVNLARDPALANLILAWDSPAGSKFVLTLMRGSKVFQTRVVLRDILKPEKISKHVRKKIVKSEAQWLIGLGDTACLETNNDQAIDNYTEAIRIKPDAADAFDGCGLAYYRKGSNELALADFNEAIRLNPRLAEAYNNRGSLRQNVWRQTARAIADYDEAIRLQPDDADAFHNRGLSHGVNGDIEQAMADFSAAIRLNPKLTGAFLDRGLGYQKKGDYDLALSDFSNAIRLQPDNAKAFSLRGTLFLQRNNYEAAISNLSVAIRLDPGDPTTLNNRGMAYRLTDAYDLAIADLDSALKLAPSNTMALGNRGYAFYGKGNYERAIADFSQAVQLGSTDSSMFAGRAASYFAVGNYPRAVEDYSTLVQREPKNAAVYFNRALALEGEGKLDESIADFTEAVSLNRNDAATIGQRGDAYKLRKDYAHALSDYEKALELEPGNPQMLIAPAELLATCPDDSFRDGKKAVQYAREACDLTSWKDAWSVEVLAMAYAADGNFAEAIKWEQTFLKAKLPENLRSSAEKRLKLYQQHKTYVETGK